MCGVGPAHRGFCENAGFRDGKVWIVSTGEESYCMRLRLTEILLVASRTVEGNDMVNAWFGFLFSMVLGIVNSINS